MNDPEKRPVVSEADVTPRNIERRTFLGRFGVAMGLVGIAGFTQACAGGEGEEATDADSSDADAAGAVSPDSATAPNPDSASDADASDSDSG